MLKAVLVGGAQMFSLGSSAAMDIGVRNEAAVRAALATERIPVVAAEVGGSKRPHDSRRLPAAQYSAKRPEVPK